MSRIGTHNVLPNDGHDARAAGRYVSHSGRRESGQITVMIIGFAIILGLVVAVVANASNVFLQRRSLVAWADGAVTAAAQQVAHHSLYSGDPLSSLPLSEAAAQEAVAGYVTRNDLAGQFDDLWVANVSVEPGGRVTVELGASVPLMIAGDVTSGATSFTVTARSTAVVPLE
ncbi:pilus assembly protein TadG-related protein [Phytoactinopolyspora endophytica]|uniref:pilus assembly protein TadG-related protein n=1 Tax=Phytoactinopolyspora endophytica TaxID=1642495 RepID=UPI00101C383C|nr:pilus assembly protein TadG-related protein [Phytoactinopolyspora endophytica]